MSEMGTGGKAAGMAARNEAQAGGLAKITARNEDRADIVGTKAGEMGLQMAGGRALTVADYEARIWIYREQAVGGYIGIGRTLNEAKAAGVVGRGEWETWVERTTGLSIRQAQRCMRAAQEIREGSFLGQLDISKATMLLSSGLDESEREILGARAAEEGTTVKELKEEIRQLKVAKVHDTGALAEAKGELKRAKEERDQIRAQMQALHKGFEARADEIRKTAYAQGKDDGAKEGGRTEAEAQGRIQAMEKQMQEAERRVRDAERQLAEQVAEARRKVRDAEQAKKEAEKALREDLNEIRRETMENARDDIRAEYEGKLHFLASEKEVLQGVVQDMRAELEAAESREAKRAKELAELRKEKAQAGMDAARGIRAERMQGMDLAAAVRTFIGSVSTLPQMGPALAGMAESEREQIRAQVDTVAEWVRASRTALEAISADASIE